MLPTIAANARKVTEYAATLGIKTCSENHGTIAQDSYRVEKLFSAVAHENYGLLVDMGNFACVDEDSAMFHAWLPMLSTFTQRTGSFTNSKRTSPQDTRLADAAVLLAAPSVKATFP